MSAAILLIDPKYGHNIGATVRAAATLGAPEVRWTGYRGAREVQARIPREERLRDYRARVDFGALDTVRGVVKPIDIYVERGFTPIAVEVLSSAESLIDFEHPHNALYVFGPEDGSLSKGIREACHRFVTIPSKGCLNLGAAVNVVLYDRLAKSRLQRLVQRLEDCEQEMVAWRDEARSLRETVATLREEGVG